MITADKKTLRSLKRRVHRYVENERVSKLKRLADKFSDIGEGSRLVRYINKISDEKKTTYLHRYAGQGNSKMVLELLRLGADPDLLDAHGNSALHNALNYVLTTGDREYFNEVCLLMIESSAYEMYTLRNKYGETVEYLVQEVFELFLKAHKSFLIPDEAYNEIDDQLWKKKLIDEMALDDCYNEDFIQEEHIDSFRIHETFSEWGDRIFCEYLRKHSSASPERCKKAAGTFRNHLEELHPSTQKSSSTKNVQNRFKLLLDREKYESLSKLIFDRKEVSVLSYKDIPWPCSMEGADLEKDFELRILDLFTYGYNEQEKLAYLKKEQVRWHPDRFMQKCRERIVSSDFEKIIETVTRISKLINTEVSRLQDLKPETNLCS